MNPDKTKVVTIEKDEHEGTFIFKFPFSSDNKKPVYSIIGCLYVEMGEDDIVSYDVGLAEQGVLEIRITANWETEEKERQRLQEILKHWYNATGYSNFKVCPINFDLTLISACWDKNNKNKLPRIHYIEAGQTSLYLIDELKWKYQASN